MPAGATAAQPCTVADDEAGNAVDKQIATFGDSEGGGVFVGCKSDPRAYDETDEKDSAPYCVANSG